MIKEFMEDFADFERRIADPLATTHADFDWPELERRLGEPESGLENGRDLLAKAVGAIFGWVLDQDMWQAGADRFIGRRMIALAWVVNPSWFDGRSMSEIARRLGVHPRSMQRLSAEATLAFGITNRGQSHGWNRRPANVQKCPQDGQCNTRAGAGQGGAE